jgi:hypothetical protein
MNKYTKKIMLLACFLTGYSFLIAQTTEKEKLSKKEKAQAKRDKINKIVKLEEEGVVVSPSQLIYGIKAYSDGIGFKLEKGISKAPYKSTLYSLEIGERKHPKEEKSNNILGSGGIIFFGSPFIYGKRNNFFFTKLAVGHSYMIGGKGNRNGVSITAVYNGGLSLGLLKPYLLQVKDPITNQLSEIRYMDNKSRTDTLFLDPNAIEAGTNIFKGFKYTKVVPGLHAGGGLRFDYGRFNDMVSAVEVGINVEFYTKKMPIMLLNKEKNLFTTLYVSLLFGKRK